MAVAPLNLAQLQQRNPIVDGEGRSTVSFLRYLNGVITELQQAVNTNAEALALIAAANTAIANANTAIATANTAIAAVDAVADAVTAESALANSYVTGLTVTATDAGASVTITISAHTRVYGNGTSVAVNVGSITGQPYSTTIRIYYDQASRLGGAVTYAATTSITTAAQSGNRHSVAAVTTPAAAAPPATGNPVFPPGYAAP